jgi:hypothetical protein
MKGSPCYTETLVLKGYGTLYSKTVYERRILVLIPHLHRIGSSAELDDLKRTNRSQVEATRPTPNFFYYVFIYWVRSLVRGFEHLKF